MAFLFAPTAYLYRFSDSNLEATWLQRWSGRNEAVNDNCAGVIFLPIDYGGSLDVESATLLACPDVPGEANLSEDKRFWEAMDGAVEPHFDDFTDTMEAEGDIKMIRANSTVFSTQRFGTELNSSPSWMSWLVIVPRQSELLVPSTEYWQFEKPVWKEGHDKVVWAAIPKDATILYFRVYPSASGEAGGGGTEGTWSNSGYGYN